MPADPWRHHATRVARAVKRGDHTEADLARRDLRAARLEEHVKEVVAKAPPLTPDQLTRLRALLNPSALEGAA